MSTETSNISNKNLDSTSGHSLPENVQIKSELNHNDIQEFEIKKDPEESSEIKTEHPPLPKSKKPKKTRWGYRDKNSLLGMPTTLPSNLSKAQVKSYLTYVRLEEINNKLRQGNYIPPKEARSPSPEPIYNSEGKQINTVELRYRKKLEDERNRLIEEALKENPNFMPPADYTRNAKLMDKVYIPQNEFPEVNFIGLLIGPRGNTLKKMEAETGAKISIRGKGSVKDGKRMDLASIPAADEDLHCLVTADSEFKSASLPEGQNDLKREQLKELALLNGTFIDEDLLNYCTNCGAMTHKKSECPEALNYTVNMVCKICNGVGHSEIDCLMRNNPEAMQQAYQREQQHNEEYKRLMTQLGENVNQNSTNTSMFTSIGSLMATFGVNQNIVTKKEDTNEDVINAEVPPTSKVTANAPWNTDGLKMPTITPGSLPPWAMNLQPQNNQNDETKDTEEEEALEDEKNDENGEDDIDDEDDEAPPGIPGLSNLDSAIAPPGLPLATKPLAKLEPPPTLSSTKIENNYILNDNDLYLSEEEIENERELIDNLKNNSVDKEKKNDINEEIPPPPPEDDIPPPPPEDDEIAPPPPE